MSFDPNQPRGHASNPGRWSAYEHTDPEATLVDVAEPALEFDHDGGPVAVHRLGTDVNGRTDYEAVDGNIRASFTVPDDATERHIEQAAQYAFDKARLKMVASRRGQIAELDAQLQQEFSRLSVLTDYPGGLRAPMGWEGQCELEAVTDWVDSPDPVPARVHATSADHVTVDEDGITYTVAVPWAMLGQEIVGPRNKGESRVKYAARYLQGSETEQWERAIEALKEDWGEVTSNPDTHSFDISFHVSYGGEKDRMSMQAMGERANEFTDLDNCVHARKSKHGMNLLFAEAAKGPGAA